MPNWVWKIVDATRVAGAANVLWGFASSPTAFLYIWAPALTAWGFVAGWKEGMPTPYLLAASALIFGGINWGILQLSFLIDRNRVRDRLVIAHIGLGADWQARPNGEIHLSVVQFIITFDNKSNFPMEFKVDSIRSMSSGRVAQGEAHVNMGGTIPEKNSTIFRDVPIRMNPAIVIPADTETIRYPGEFEFTVRYGRVGRLRHTVKRKMACDVVFHRRDPRLFTVMHTLIS